MQQLTLMDFIKEAEEREYSEVPKPDEFKDYAPHPTHWRPALPFELTWKNANDKHCTIQHLSSLHEVRKKIKRIRDAGGTAVMIWQKTRLIWRTNMQMTLLSLFEEPGLAPGQITPPIFDNLARSKRVSICSIPRLAGGTPGENEGSEINWEPR